MQEFSSVTASSYDADALAPLLSEKSAEGWEVVSIVSAGTNIVAYLRRQSDGVAAAATAPATEEAATEEPGAEEPAAEEETPVLPGGVEAGAAVAAGSAEAAGGAPAAEPAAEPAGWAAAPETTEPEQEAAGEPAAEPAAADTSVADLATEVDATPEPAAEPAPAEPEPAPAAAAAEPAVPAGWYADPSGRFELRYWDGSAWTEHVSRAGQQFTDPPVA